MEQAATKTSVKTQKPRSLIEEKIARILIESYYLPQKQNENGAFFIDNYSFAANVKILGIKLGINPNSLNKDFRHHNIKCIQKFPNNKSANLFDAKGWKVYQHSNNIFSLENILKKNTKVATKWEKSIQNNPIKNKPQTKKRKSQPIQNSNIDKNVNIEESPAAKILHKNINQKSSNINDPFSEEEDNYMFFIV